MKKIIAIFVFGCWFWLAGTVEAKLNLDLFVWMKWYH